MLSAQTIHAQPSQKPDEIWNYSGGGLDSFLTQIEENHKSMKMLFVCLFLVCETTHFQVNLLTKNSSKIHGELFLTFPEFLHEAYSSLSFISACNSEDVFKAKL